MTFAQLLQGERRPLAEVLLDATHTADAAMRDARLRLVEGEEVTVAQLDRLLELTRLAHHLAKVSTDAGVEVALLNEARASVAELGVFMRDTFLAVLDALPLTPAWRTYLVDLADHRLLEVARTQGTRVLEAPSGESLDPPVPPSGPVLVGAVRPAGTWGDD